MLTGVYHTGLSVADLDRSIAFYRDLLGLELIGRFERSGEGISRVVGYEDAHLSIAMLRVPGAEHMLELLEYRQPRGQRLEQEPKQPGSAHLCFIVNDSQALHRRLVEAGVQIRSREAPVPSDSPVNPGGFVTYLHDPDGFTVELLESAPGRRPYGL